MADPVRMTLAEAAQALNTTPDALRKKIRRGTLKAARDNAGRLLV
jgi:excisionase family DNA binding protein